MIMSPLWILVPLLAIVAAITVGIVLVFIDPSFGGSSRRHSIAVALFIYLNYVIDWTNAHGARPPAPGVTSMYGPGARSGERPPWCSPRIAMESIDQGLASPMCLIPPRGAYHPHPHRRHRAVFLHAVLPSKFAFEHDDRWHAFANVHRPAANGDNVPPIPGSPGPSFLLYLVITIIFSPFLIYWYLN